MKNQFSPQFYECRVWAEVIFFAQNSQKTQGRMHPILTGYRPNHAFEMLGVNESNQIQYRAVMGQITLLDREILLLDTEAIVEIKFILVKEMLNKIVPNFTWQIFEGGKLVGNGKIIEILSEHRCP